MNPAVGIAILTNIVTLIVLLVTQVMNKRNERIRRMEERRQRLQESRRSAYSQLLQACDEQIQTAELHMRDPEAPVSPSVMFPGLEGSIGNDLVTMKGVVELVGSPSTIKASTQLVSAVNELAYNELASDQRAAELARQAFLNAARRDLDADLMA